MKILYKCLPQGQNENKIFQSLTAKIKNTMLYMIRNIRIRVRVTYMQKKMSEINLTQTKTP